MKHYKSANFRRMFDRLPEEVQALTRRNFELLKQDPRHPSLHFKRIATRWSVRIGRSYRALATEVDDGFLWFAGSARTMNTCA